jgi:DNA-binding SARP family transcriptional activator/DNA-binding CsgD family transcriptional regulator/tetratricopeptide (TPR) repeat protein
MDFRILGPLEVSVSGRSVALGSGKLATLLGVLLLHVNEVVSVDRLVDELWGERPPADAIRLVQGYVSGLRRRLGPGRIGTRPPGYLIWISTGELDAAQFERLVAVARVGQPKEVAARLREALALWRGPALADVRFAGFALREAQRLDELRLAALLDRIDADLAMGRHTQLVDELSRLVAEHPMDERVSGQLMLTLDRCGRSVEALEVYRRLRVALSEEFGLDPGGHLQALHFTILRQDRARAETVPPRTPAALAGSRPRSSGDSLPGPLRLPPSVSFAGRWRELEILREMLPRAIDAGRRIALVGGEAGAGKSRLVREVAHEAAADGVLVLYGACDPVMSMPYQPIVEALTHLAQVTPPDILHDVLGTAGGELIRLLPDLATRVKELSSPIHADPDTERHRLNTAIADLLANVGSRQPVLLIVEDGHWADPGTLLLLRHLARAATHARLLLVVTFRDTDADIPATLADALAELRRSDDVVRMRIEALTDEEIGQFVSAACGGRPEPAAGLTRRLRDLTAGNAFLLCELWRTLAESGGVVVADGTINVTGSLEELATPRGIREVVSQRLARLPRTTNDLLDLAAVAGTEFEVDLLRRAAPTLLEPIDSLAPAERSGMIDETTSPTLTYRFSHELVRRAIYDGLTGVARAQLHLRVGEALVAQHASPPAHVVAALARHFTAALPLGRPERAVRYNVLAARAAAGALAFEEAAARLRSALQIGVDDDRERAQLHLELGTVCLRSGQSFDSLDAFRTAVQIARRLGDGDMLARAAVGTEDAGSRLHIVDTDAVELLREALTALSGGDSPRRVRLLAGLARSVAAYGDRAGAVVVRDSAVRMARRINDRRGLAVVLLHDSWARDNATPRQLVEIATESRDVAAEIGDLETLAEAMALRVAALAAAGDIDAAQRQLAEATEMATRMRQPFLLHIVAQHTSALALMQGRLDEAEVAAGRARAWAQLLTGADASTDHGIQMFGIRREQGRLAEFAGVARAMTSHRPDGIWRASFAALLTELDMMDDLARELADVRRDGLGAAGGSLWLASLTYLTDACSAAGDQDVAASIYPQLEPYGGTNVMIGYSVASYGAADRYLGMLAATFHDTSLANRHFDAALQLNRRMGATTWLAHTCYQYGRLLRLSDSERSKALLAQASALARQVGMPALLDRIGAVGGTRKASRRLPDGLSEREGEVLPLLARGLSNRQIGTILAISEHTTANHVRNILRKTGCANRTDVASYVHRHGLANE